MTNSPNSSGATTTTTVISNNPAKNQQICNDQKLVGYGVGGLAIGGLINYGLHTWMLKNAPSYVTMGQGAKLAGAAGIVGVCAYAMGSYMENRCRRERGLPTH